LGITVELELTSQFANFIKQIFVDRRNITMSYKSEHTLWNSVMKTRPETDPQQTAERVHSIPCECGRSYIGETDRPLVMRLREHRHRVKDVLIDKSKLAQLV
jgi:hypothetical protein